ncbi:porin family protein [Photobacterium sp. J15]|uniref:porin family protein n=1 Tax=Photobacterium sp. J15 TaxID=265901 RepID=UPI0007E47555|nr:porin family protein [Photobacterium sp. J15]
MKFFKIIAVFSSLLVASFSHAKDVRGFYVGAGVGTIGVDDQDGFFDVFEDLPFDVAGEGNTYKLIAGYQVNHILALEAQYTKYGDVKIASKPVTVQSWEPEALSFTANAGYTFNNGLRPFGILGLSMLELNESSNVDFLKLDEDKYLGLRYGLGIEYMPPAFNALSVRLAYEADFFYAEKKETRHGAYSDYTITELYDFTLDSVYLSVSYRF